MSSPYGQWDLASESLSRKVGNVRGVCFCEKQNGVVKNSPKVEFIMQMVVKSARLKWSTDPCIDQ